MTLPERVLSVDMPPIDALNTRMAELQARGHDVISLNVHRLDFPTGIAH